VAARISSFPLIHPLVLDPQLWTSGEAGGAGGWTPKSLSFGRFGMQHVTSAQWLPPRGGPGSECMIVAGMSDGQLYLFKGATCVKAIAAHRPGPKSIQVRSSDQLVPVSAKALGKASGPDIWTG